MTDELFFDTDCLSAFLWINNTNILQTLYSGRIVLPEPVYQELSNPSIPHIKQRADKLISTNVASVQQIVTGTEEYDLYSSLIKGIKGEKQIGRGEAAGIALTKTYNGIFEYSGRFYTACPAMETVDSGMMETAIPESKNQ